MRRCGNKELTLYNKELFPSASDFTAGSFSGASPFSSISTLFPFVMSVVAIRIV